MQFRDSHNLRRRRKNPNKTHNKNFLMTFENRALFHCAETNIYIPQYVICMCICVVRVCIIWFKIAEINFPSTFSRKFHGF